MQSCMIPQILTGGGRANDIQITEKSGYLDKLLHGDTILADRGFPISEIVGTRV